MDGPESQISVKDLLLLSSNVNRESSSYSMLEGIISPGQRQEDCHGNLYFRDSTGIIPCIVERSYLQPRMLGKRIRVCDPLTLSGSTGEHLLIRGPLVNIDGDENSLAILEAVSVCTACYIKSNRSSLESETVNIMGTVDSLSEVVKLKADLVFVVTMTAGDHKIQIVVKRPEFIHWQKLIDVRDKYIFSALRPTTFNKGLDTEFQVFALTRRSKLYHHSEVDVSLLALKDVMKDTLDVASIRCQHQIDNSKLITYEGIVTSCQDSDKGILELDQKVRLYLSHVPATSWFNFVCEGTEIAVHNCHYNASKQEPKLRLSACYQSCLKFVKFPEATKHKQQQMRGPGALVDACQRWNWSLDDLEAALAFGDALHIKLSPQIPDIADLLVDLLSVPLAGSQAGERLLGPPCPPTKRNHVTEYLHHGRSLCPILQSTKSPIQGRHVVTMREVREFGEAWATDWTKMEALLDPLERNQGERPGAPSSRDLNNRLYWSTESWQSQTDLADWILLGVLKTDKTTGQLSLVDQTGYTHCVIAPWNDTGIDGKSEESSDAPSTSAPASSPMDTAPPGAEAPHGCPEMDPQGDLCPGFAQSCCMNLLVRVDRFRVVCERFLQCRFPSRHDVGDARFVDELTCRVYLQFSMEDVCRLQRMTRRDLGVPGLEPCHGVCKLEAVYRKHKLSEASRDIETACREPKQSRPCLDIQGEPTDGMCDQVSMNHAKEKSASSERGLTSAADNLLQTFILLHKDALAISSQGKPSFSARVCLIGETFRASDAPRERSTCSRRKTPTQRVVLTFHGDSRRWYHLLYSGATYCLLKRGAAGMASFECAPLQNARITRAVGKTGAQRCVAVTSDMEIIRLSDMTPNSDTDVAADSLAADMDTLCLTASGKLRSPSDILHSGPEAQLVSLEAVVVGRCFEQEKRSNGEFQGAIETNGKLGLSVPGGRDLHLTLARDLASDDQLDVYVSLERVSYPLGLLVGCRLRLYNLERRESRKGRVYLRHTVATSCHVLSNDVTPAATHRPQPVGSVTHLQHPVMSLQSLWSADHAQQPIVCIIGHVQRLQKLSIRLTCDQCNAAYVETLSKGRCFQCRSEEEPSVVASASFQLDDGTSLATVYCNGERLVRCLLTLTTEQWVTLKRRVMSTGVLSYIATFTGGSIESTGLNGWMDRMAQTTRVLRPIKVTGQRFRTFMDTNRKRRRALDDLCLDDFMEKSMKIGGDDINTKFLPWLQLECVDLQEVDYSSTALSFLNYAMHKDTS